MPFVTRICSKCKGYWFQNVGRRRFEMCPACRSPIYSAAMRDYYKRHRRALQLHWEAKAMPEPITPLDLDKLMADVDRASESALNRALAVIDPKWEKFGKGIKPRRRRD